MVMILYVQNCGSSDLDIGVVLEMGLWWLCDVKGCDWMVCNKWM